ncbi:hypothetical protein OIU79_010063 [Salix purpurea]|uniref:Uncharacterized protein n=1 Tax=Salix purpurea TaxID=77065 RepID=A0A9Q0QF51_SALPP|nr:hypothetical protein OIU79_010063 [Salix purpurea]
MSLYYSMLDLHRQQVSDQMVAHPGSLRTCIYTHVYLFSSALASTMCRKAEEYFSGAARSSLPPLEDPCPVCYERKRDAPDPRVTGFQLILLYAIYIPSPLTSEHTGGQGSSRATGFLDQPIITCRLDYFKAEHPMSDFNQSGSVASWAGLLQIPKKIIVSLEFHAAHAYIMNCMTELQCPDQIGK